MLIEKTEGLLLRRRRWAASSNDIIARAVVPFDPSSKTALRRVRGPCNAKTFLQEFQITESPLTNILR